MQLEATWRFTPQFPRTPPRRLTDASGGPVRASEHHRHRAVPRRHVQLLGGGVEDLVDSLEGEVERHELHHRAEILVRRSRGEPRESHLRDGGVDHPLLPVLLVEPLRDLFIFFFCSRAGGSCVGHEEDDDDGSGGGVRDVQQYIKRVSKT